LLQILKSFVQNRVPGQLIIQMTDHCNATCPQCGMRTTEKFRRTTLDTDHIKRLIDAAAEQSFQAISFTGGEPLLYTKKLADLIQYAGQAGIPYIRTGTNGFVFRNPDKLNFLKRIHSLAETLAQTPLRNFWISVDSHVDAIHEEMRGFKGVMRGIEKALPIFHDWGLYPSVNLGINRNVGGDHTRSYAQLADMSDKSYLDGFEHIYYKAFCRFYQRAIDMGFTIANACYPMSINVDEEKKGLQAVYPASSVDNVVRFSDQEKKRLFAALMRSVAEYRSKIRIFSPLCSLHALIMDDKQGSAGYQAAACRGGIDFFFVDSKDGATYPCGYRGSENMGSLWNLNIERLASKLYTDKCTRCDWECFRDPSELMDPVLKALRSPLKLLSNWHKHPVVRRFWIQDILYYQSCDFFNGRKPMNFRKLARFRSN